MDKAIPMKASSGACEATPSSTEAVDALLASELNNMTVADRTNVFEEIHGVAEYAPEEYTAEKLKRSLHLLSEALASIEDKPAYDKAQEIASNNIDSDKEKLTTFVNDDEFRLKFLRAEQFNAQKAAERMVKNLNLLERYLGIVGLSRPICISDLDIEGLQIIKAGAFQLLPFRDRTGRRIAVRIGPLGIDFIKNEKSMMKTLLYLYQVLSEDVESQKRGLVMISFPSINFDPTTISDPKAKRHIYDILNSIAIRFASNHMCFPDKPWFRALGSLFLLASPTSIRVRTRLHFGSITECQYKMMGYGIPADQLPIKNSGTIKTQNQKKWIAFRQMKDDAIEQDGISVFCPSTKDVLAIGGMHFYKFPGNVAYREMLESKLGDYDNAASVQEKIRITTNVLIDIKASGGRFLVKDKKGWWALANAETARIKVSNAFRDVRKSNRARENRKRIKSDTHKFAKIGHQQFCAM